MLVSYGNTIQEAINDRVISLHQSFRTEPFIGLVETVPSYSSLTVFYDPLLVRNGHPGVRSAADLVKAIVRQRADTMNETPALFKKKTVIIPVYYHGEDLDFVASQNNLSKEEVITLHHSRTYRVFIIGFLPGFPYMGPVDERIATARRSSPRTKVKAGSIGIAGFQTGIYPLDSPGGWQLIGETPLKIFDKMKEPVCLLAASDEVRFVPITREEFERQDEYHHS